MTDVLKDTENAKFDKLDAQSEDSRQYFDTVLVQLGQKPKAYFPKLKDENGSEVKDENGRVVKSKKQAGWMYTMAEYQSCEAVRFVLTELKEVERGQAYKVTGFGYGPQKGSKWIDKDVKIFKY